MTSNFKVNPRLRVRPATPADADDMARILFDAFSGGVMNELMYPDGGSADARAKFGASLFPPRKGGSGDEDLSGPAASESIPLVAELLPAEDDKDARPVVVAQAKWTVVREPLPDEVWDVQEVMTDEMMGEGASAAVYNAFIGGMHVFRQKWQKGDPHLYLGTLTVDPKQQRCGAGSALLAWGLELADKERLTTWLISSPVGYGLYRKFGFEAVDVQDLKVTETWGRAKKVGENWGEKSAVETFGELPDGVHRSTLMRRLPKTA